jgi:predicted transcriptional regulator
MDVVISIKPKYVRQILTGAKTYEYRKTVPKQKFNRIYIYESAPIKKIVAWFTVKKIMKAIPADLWKSTFEQSGLEKAEFDNYFRDKEYAYALQIDEMHILEKPVNAEETVTPVLVPAWMKLPLPT